MTVYEDEIDLRPYIQAIIQHWWQILLVALVAAALGLAYSLTRPRVYESTATILMIRSRPTLNLAEQFPTVNEPIDTRSRIDALLSITQSDALALQVIQALGSDLPSGDRDIDSIKGKVKLSNKGDLLLVTAQATNPAMATKIANAWAGESVKAINAAYNGEQPLSEIQNQLQSTRQDYDQAQNTLEIFIQDNKIDLLQKQIAEAQTLFNKLASDRPYQISYYSYRKQTMEDLKVQAEGLKTQLQSGGISSAGVLGDGLAVLIARARSLGVNLNTVTEKSNEQNNIQINDQNISADNTQKQDNTVPPEYSFAPQANSNLTIQIGDLNILKDSSASYVADLDALIKLSQDEIARADEALNTLGQQVNKGQTSSTIEATAEKIRALQTELEAEQARQKDLTSQRDLTWKAYQATAQKETELRNANQTNSQVTLAGQAVPPEDPASRGTVRNTLIAGFLGLILGSGAVLASHWWRSFNQSTPVVTPG